MCIRMNTNEHTSARRFNDMVEFYQESVQHQASGPARSANTNLKLLTAMRRST